jgi:CRISPR-associated endonuclease/helicase Cas3
LRPRLLEAHAPREPAPDGSAAFLDGGYYATTQDFRDIEEFTASAVLDGDLAALEPLVKAKKPWDGFVVPVPRREGELLGDDQRPAWLPRGVGLARSDRYNDDYGYEKGGSAQ